MDTPKILQTPNASNSWSDGTENSVQLFKQGKFTVEIMPEGYILLAKEIATGYHPKLEQSLSTTPLAELDERLLKVAAYVGVVVDGIYSIQERSTLCAIMAGRLEMLRDYTKGENVQRIITGGNS